MGQARLLARHHDRHDDGAAPHGQPGRSDHLELEALRDENAQLRELVIQLSKLVIKNVVDRK
jgi:hypothetical protein